MENCGTFPSIPLVAGCQLVWLVCWPFQNTIKSVSCASFTEACALETGLWPTCIADIVVILQLRLLRSVLYGQRFWYSRRWR